MRKTHTRIEIYPHIGNQRPWRPGVPKQKPEDWHRSTGELLKSMHDLLLELEVELSNTYGKDCRERRAAKNANRQLLLLRSDLESRLAKEHSKLTDLVSVYFGARVAKITSEA